jgi:tRNA(Ile)-lysidine synthase TilS/MesJ
MCAVCGAIRRAILPRVAQRAGAEVLCTGHTLDDQLVYALKDLLSGRAHPPRPVLPATAGFPQKSKPLFFLPERATAIYCGLAGLPTVAGACPRFDPSTHRFKAVFELLERLAPLGKKQLLTSLSRFITRPKGPDREEHPCPVCGLPTSFSPCPLCRLRASQAGGDR